MSDSWDDDHSPAPGAAVSVNTEAADALRRLMATRRDDLIDDPRRAEAMLRDLVPLRPAEVNVLTAAHYEGVPARLLGAAETGLLEVARRQAIDHLERDYGMRPGAAAWSVETWVDALGLVRASADDAPAPTGPVIPSQPEPPGRSSQPPDFTVGNEQDVLTPVTIPDETPPGSGAVRSRWLAWVIVILSVVTLATCALVLAFFVSDLWRPGGVARIWSVIVGAVAVVLWLGGATVVGQQKGAKWGWLAFVFGVGIFPVYTFQESRGWKARSGEPLSRVPMTAAMVIWTLICIIPYNLAL
jgi:hypothetical protein